MKDLDEGAYWIVFALIVATAATIISVACYTAMMERDRMAISRGYVQRVEQSRMVWTQP